MKCRNGFLKFRCGFTLVELLVVIAIIGILVGLLLPAVQAAREAARRMQCSNNLKQHGLALLNYESTYKRFPIGFTDTAPTNAMLKDGGWSWMCAILPYIEQNSLYNTLDLKLHPFGTGSNAANKAACAVPLSAFRCPSDIAPLTKASNLSNANGTAALAVTSYCGVLGSFDGQWCLASGTTNVVGVRNHGLLVVNSSRRISEVTDGTSNVFAVGEVSYRLLNAAGNGSDRQYILGNVTTGGGPLCSSNGANNNGAHLHLRANRRKLNGPLATGVKHEAFHSFHTGGAQFAFVDGSIHFISDSIQHTDTNFTDPGVTVNGPFGTYQRMASIDDGNVVSLEL